MITGRRGKGEMWWEQIANPTRHALWCWNGWRWRLDARLLWHGVHCSWWPVAKENEDENLTGHPDRFYEAHLFVFCQYKSTHATLGAQFLHWPQWWPRKVKGLGKHISAGPDRSLSGRSNQTWQPFNHSFSWLQSCSFYSQHRPLFLKHHDHHQYSDDSNH